MKKNIDAYERSLVRMEKNATNHVGLFLVIVLAIVIFGVGGFLLYKNRDSIDWSLSLPWDNKDDDNSPSSKKDKDKQSSEREELAKPKLNNYKVIEDRGITLIADNLVQNDQGFTFDLIYTNYNGDVTFTLEKVLVDKYDTTANFTEKVPAGQTMKKNVHVKQTELDIVNIKNFANLTLYIRIDTEDGPGKAVRYNLVVNNLLLNENKLEGLIEFENNKQSIISFYQVTEDKDNSYIYFDYLNDTANRTQVLTVKKLVINDEIYDVKSFSNEIYHGAEKLLYITVPKKDFKKIEKFTIGFTVLNYIDDELYSVYITKEYSKTL